MRGRLLPRRSTVVQQSMLVQHLSYALTALIDNKFDANNIPAASRKPRSSMRTTESARLTRLHKKVRCRWCTTEAV